MRSIDLYYRRREAHIKAVEAREQRRKEHEDKIDSSMELLLSTLSISVRTTFKAEIPTRRLDYIWSKIAAKCGPRSGIEGIGELSKEWATLNINSSEQMTEFLQRLERTSTKFEAYGAQWHKSDEHKIVQARQALMGDTKNWEDWKREVRDSERLGEGWSELTTRLEKTAGEIRADAAAAKDTAPKPASRHEKAAVVQEGTTDVASAAAAKGGRQRETPEERAARVALSTCFLLL
jgi:hypothetical protein